MRLLLKAILSGALLVATTVPSTSAWGSAPGFVFEITKNRGYSILGHAGVFSNGRLKAAGIHAVQMTEKNGANVIRFLNSKGEEILSAVMRQTAPAVLDQFKPSKLTQLAIVTAQKAPLIPFVSLKRFPIEALTFAAAIGGITYWQVMTAYYENPAALDHYLEAQMDFYTQFSFYAFIVASGLVSEPLMEVVRNKPLRMMIPYLGMSVGMAASHRIMDYISIPGMRECVNARLKRAENKDEICDAAYTYYNQLNQNPEYRAQKARDFEAGLYSLFAAAAVSGAVTWGAAKVIELVGVNIALSLLPGGLLARIPNFFWVLARNSNFMINMTWLEEPVHTFYINGWNTAPTLKNLSYCLGAHFAKAAAYNPTYQLTKELHATMKGRCYRSFAEDYSEFIETMVRFRSENMRPVIAAQRSWEDYLARLTSHYRSTQAFYQAMTDSVYNRNLLGKKGPTNPLDTAMPLFGVYPLSDVEFDWAFYLEDNIQPLLRDQVARVHEVNKALKKALAEEEARGDKGVLNAREKKFLSELTQFFSSEDVNVIGEGIQRLVRAASEKATRINVPLALRQYFSETFTKYLDQVYAALGNPKPKTFPGEGYTAAWDSLLASTGVGEAMSQSFPNSNHNVLTPGQAEYLVSAMFWGPEAKDRDQMVRVNWSGFRSEFSPPKIVPGEVFSWSTRPTRDEQGKEYERIFTNLVWLSSDRTPGCDRTRKECYKPMWDWIREGYIIPEIMPTQANEGTDFAPWWESTVRPAYLRAWYDFERKYEDVIKMFLQTFYGEDKYLIRIPGTNIKLGRYISEGYHLFNGSDVKNGVLAALNQEREVALLIFSRLADPDFKPKSTRTFRGAKFSIVRAAAEQESEFSPLMGEYLRLWEETTSLFLGLKVPAALLTDPSGSFKIGARISNDALVDTVRRLNGLVDEAFGIIAPGLVSEEDRRLAELVRRSLVGVNGELLDYGLIVNSVSYVANHENRSQDVFSRCLRTTDPSLNPFRAKLGQETRRETCLD